MRLVLLLSSGIRISRTGRRFWIRNAVVWELFEDLVVDTRGGSSSEDSLRIRKGQAALFFRKDVEYISENL